MALLDTTSFIWNEIERSESYLVCCMFEKAANLASSVLHSISKTDYATSIETIQLADMMESAGMVLVQSLKALGRTSQILEELKSSFGSLTNIPVQVLLTGACFQISDGSHSGLCELLDEFLGKWRYLDGQSYILVSAESNDDSSKGSTGHPVLEVDKYLEVVEVYVVRLLGELYNKTDLAIGWVENAELPDEKRQDLVRRLRSLFSPKPTKSSETEALASKSEVESTIHGSGESLGNSKVKYIPTDGDNRKQTLLNLSERMKPCFWWFRTVNLRFGSARFAISHGKIALWGSFIIFICYILQKKRASLKQIASRQASFINKALVDLWQLAFSVQVNPLAAVQPLSVAAHGSRG